MQGEKRERWHQISEQMETEQDPNRFIELSKELLRLLDEKRRRLKAPKEDISQAAARIVREATKD